MSHADQMRARMDAACLKTQAEKQAARGLGRWPVESDMIEERRAKAQEEADRLRAQRKAEAIARARAKAEGKARKRGSGDRRSTVPLPVEAFGGRLRNARMKLNIGQREFAIRCKVHPAMISQWERGPHIPRPPAMEMLARELGVTVEWLREGKR